MSDFNPMEPQGNAGGQQPNPYEQPQYGQPQYAQPQYGQPYDQQQYTQQYPSQPYAQGGYYVAPTEKWNTMCIVGFVLSFLLPLVGLVLSIIALVQINKTGEKSKGMAIAGIVIGALATILSIAMIGFIFWFAGYAVEHANEMPEWLESEFCNGDTCTFCEDGNCYRLERGDDNSSANYWDSSEIMAPVDTYDIVVTA
ncbi:DUF4190 domain-containing protein [Bifidobacterium cuniculi]|uniref:Peptidyl-prolyl cis-trans isomerase n=1 Tax=Bifidobacterium cuniculi TaxID=1688 RepID=A0A087AHU3_9BIFI|nr:DUF4190 domain-containing protein [Bifidobacterium cuniculi]KFI58343.1 peptidyl-prolyl cis-trans isomerase [Bifidobacterium cuniculi]